MSAVANNLLEAACFLYKTPLPWLRSAHARRDPSSDEESAIASLLINRGGVADAMRELYGSLVDVVGSAMAADRAWRLLIAANEAFATRTTVDAISFGAPSNTKFRAIRRPITCEKCGVEFSPLSRTNKPRYCSRECSRPPKDQIAEIDDAQEERQSPRELREANRKAFERIALDNAAIFAEWRRYRFGDESPLLQKQSHSEFELNQRASDDDSEDDWRPLFLRRSHLAPKAAPDCKGVTAWGHELDVPTLLRFEAFARDIGMELDIESLWAEGLQAGEKEKVTDGSLITWHRGKWRPDYWGAR